MKIRLICFTILLIAGACTRRNLVYLSDLNEQATLRESINNKAEPIIQSGDLLSIWVKTLSSESNFLFNKGVLLTTGGPNNSMTPSKEDGGYLVDKDGMIDFPVLGKIKLAGLTKAEATSTLNAAVSAHVKNPIIDIRFLNFKVTVLGEVQKPSVYTINSEKINVLEVLGMAGDITPFGKRENVLVIREDNGIRTATRLNLNSKEVLHSPHFYLQQNDIVYVEPIRTRAFQASNTAVYLPIVSAVASMTSIIILLFR